MKILNFVVKAHQKSESESKHQENLFYSDLPGFLRDCLLPISPSSKVETEFGKFRIIVENNIFQLIHNDQKHNIENYQILELDNNIVIDIVSEDIDELNHEQEKEEKSLIKNIIYAIPKVMPKISNEYALINDHFSVSPINNKVSNGNILKDLGFLESRNIEMNSLIKFW